jgi:hypothetical protein
MATTSVLKPLQHATRNQVYTALFNFLQLIPAPSIVPNTGLPITTKWKTYSQWLKEWTDVPSENQPALFLHRGPEEAIQNHAYQVTKWVWNVTVWMYFRTDGLRTTNFYPDMLTDPIKDAIEQLFQTQTQPQAATLGGLVQNIKVSGTLYCDCGLIDGQGVIIVPLAISI